MTTTSTRRTTAWTFVCYPESLPDNWQELMQALHVSLAWILHDRDKSNGKKLKPHIHVLVKYDSVKALEQVRQDFAFTGIKHIEQVRSFHTMTRYLIHLDDQPEKTLYRPDEVHTMGGLALDFTKHYSISQQVDMVQEMIFFCEDNDVDDYDVFFRWCAQNNKDWLQLLIFKCSFAMNNYFRSKKHRLKNFTA